MQSFKYLYGSAFRAPNENELNTVYFGDRVRSLRPESIDTHEFVWERYLNDRVRTSLSTYWYKADQLITTEFDPNTVTGVSFVNQGQVRAKGLELEAQVRLRGDARTLVSYAIQEAVDQQTQLELPNSPRHVAKARISLPGPTPGSFVSLEGQYLSSRMTLVGSRVAGAGILNVHVVQPLGRDWQLFGGVQNLLDTEYSDPVSGSHRQDAIEQNGRTARVGLRWQLWRP
jgi:iron complex outermembrane receptor protein